MKLWNLATLLTVSLLIFSGCVSTTPKPKQGAQIDSTLPVVSLTQNGIVSDMQAIAFEWMSIKDPKVDGIYIYKKDLSSKNNGEHKYYDTVKSRFVTHYVDEDVKPNSTYSYYFKTFSKDAESQPSVESVVKTLPALESVSWIHAIQDMPRSAKIIWRPHANQIVESYTIERKTLSDDDWKKLTTLKGRLNVEYIDDDLKDNHVYKYRILVNTYNDITSKPSAEVNVVTKALPKPVDNIIASKDLAKKIILRWHAPKDKEFSHFNVYRSTSVDGSYSLVSKTKNSEYIDDIEEDGEDYFYRVGVVDKDGLESKHEDISAYGQTLIKPMAPSLVEAKVVGDNIQLNWKSTDSRVKSFIVSKSVKTGIFKTSKEDFTDIKGNKFIDTAIEPSTTYVYNVYSVDQFSIKSEASIDVILSTNENQGKIIEQKTDDGLSIEVEKAPSSTNSKGVVKPVEDFDMSEL